MKPNEYILPNGRSPEMTYREWLIGMIASGPEPCAAGNRWQMCDDGIKRKIAGGHAEYCIQLADEIIKQLSEKDNE